MSLRNRTDLSAEAVDTLTGADQQPSPSSAASIAPPFTALEEPLQVAAGDEYAQLRRLVKQAGLLEKQPAYYARKFVLTLTMLAAGLAFLALVDNIWLQLVDAVLLAAVFAQMAFLGHDAGHRQIFRSARRNDIVGLGMALFLGMVRTWWVDKHNRHHSFPNELGKDPDVDIPVLAFDEKDALRKKGLFRIIVKYQAYLFIVMLSMEGFVGLRLAGIQYMFRKKLKYPVAEPLIMIAHFAAYLGLVFYLLSPWHAAIFIVVHQVLFGLYMGAVFAPNHKGMPMIYGEVTLDYLRRQVITARNINPNPVTDFCYGGLNYQIEHHLFPDMPRNRLGEARKIVRAYCLDRGISYYETNPLRAGREILGFLHKNSAPLRSNAG